MNRLFPENSYMGNCSCGTDFIARKGTLHCHNCLYNKIAELEKERAPLSLAQFLCAYYMEKNSNPIDLYNWMVKWGYLTKKEQDE